MITSIYKYRIGLTDRQVLQLPQGCRIMTVANQREQLFLWAWVPVDPVDRKPTSWEVYIIGTGNDADILLDDELLTYLGTVLMRDGELVRHVFVRPLRST